MLDISGWRAVPCTFGKLRTLGPLAVPKPCHLAAGQFLQAGVQVNHPE